MTTNKSSQEQFIYDYFVGRLQSRNGSLVSFVRTFDAFFIEHNEAQFSRALASASHQIAAENRQLGFIQLIKSISYRYIDACLEHKTVSEISALAQLYVKPRPTAEPRSLTAERFQDWFAGFASSDDAYVFRAIAAPQGERPVHWTSRYISLLFLAQSLKPDAPADQTRVSKRLYLYLSNHYRARLLAYLSANNVETSTSNRKIKNPTLIGDTTLNLLSRLLKKRNPGFRDTAQAFLQDTNYSTLAEWEPALIEYLFSEVTTVERLKWLPDKIHDYLESKLLSLKHQQFKPKFITQVSHDLLVYLLNPDNLNDFSHPLTVLLVQREFLMLSLLLFKLILIAPENHRMLQESLGVFIEINRARSHDDCRWLIGFVETMQVVIALALSGPEFPTSGLPRYSPLDSHEPSLLA